MPSKEFPPPVLPSWGLGRNTVTSHSQTHYVNPELPYEVHSCYNG